MKFRFQFRLMTLLWAMVLFGLFLELGLPLIDLGRLSWINWRSQRAAERNRPWIERLRAAQAADERAGVDGPITYTYMPTGAGQR